MNNSNINNSERIVPLETILDQILDAALDQYDREASPIHSAITAIQASIAPPHEPVKRFLNTNEIGLVASFLEMSEIPPVVTDLVDQKSRSQVISQAFAQQMGSRFVNNNLTLSYDDYLIYIQAHPQQDTFPNIVQLNLSHTHISCMQVKELVRKCPNLMSLDLSHTKMCTNEYLAHLRALPLENLNLSHTETSSNTLFALMQFKFPLLQTLDLSHTQVDDGGLSYLRGFPLKNLNLSHCPIKGKGLAHLDKDRLTFLNLRGTRINFSHALTLHTRFPNIKCESDIASYKQKYIITLIANSYK